jgi:hypothetical protein
MPVRSSFDDVASAEAALEAQAPLVESLRRYATAASQLTVMLLINTASALFWFIGWRMPCRWPSPGRLPRSVSACASRSLRWIVVLALWT